MQYLENEPLTNNLEIPIKNVEPYASTQMPLRILAELPTKEHQVTLMCPWATKPIVVVLSFTPLLSISWRLHTVMHRKFLQVIVSALSEQKLQITAPYLKINNDVNVNESINGNSSQVYMFINL